MTSTSFPTFPGYNTRAQASSGAGAGSSTTQDDNDILVRCTQQSSSTLQDSSPLRVQDAALQKAERDLALRKIQHEINMQELAEAKMRAEVDALQRSNAITAIQNIDDERTGEKYSQEVIDVVDKIPGAYPKDIHSILTHKFNPLNLTRLRLGIGLRPREQQDVTRIDSTTQQLVLKRIVGSLKDFGDNPLIWIESFSNYMRIIGLLFGKKHADVWPAMNHFMSRIVRHSHDYEWQSVLAFALARHEHASNGQIPNPKAWDSVPEEWSAFYFNPTTLRSNKRPRPTQG